MIFIAMYFGNPSKKIPFMGVNNYVDEIIKLEDVYLDLPEEVIEARNYQYNLINWIFTGNIYYLRLQLFLISLKNQVLHF